MHDIYSSGSMEVLESIAEKHGLMLSTELINFADDVWAHATQEQQVETVAERKKISIEYLAGAGDGGADVWVAEKASHPYACGQGRTPSEALSNLFSDLDHELDKEMEK